LMRATISKAARPIEVAARGFVSVAIDAHDSPVSANVLTGDRMEAESHVQASSTSHFQRKYL
jgi:hypothetical protein